MDTDIEIAPPPDGALSPWKRGELLWRAVAAGDLERVDALLGSGPVDGNRLWTSLEMAMCHGEVEAARRIWALAPPYPGAQAREGPAVLMFHAAQSDQGASVAWIASVAPEAVDARYPENASGETPLSICAHLGRPSAARALLASGARLRAAGADGWDAAAEAAFRGEVEVLAALVEFGIDPREERELDARAANGWAPAAGKPPLRRKMSLEQIASESMAAVSKGAALWLAGAAKARSFKEELEDLTPAGPRSRAARI